MAEITAARSASQPVNTRTGGSTFKNPPGEKAWQLVDTAGCRGLVNGDAQVSELHTNFLINRGAATAAELEDLGEQYATLQGLGVEVYGVSTDTHFSHKARPDTSDKIGKIQYAFLGDQNHNLTNNYGVLREGVGLADRATFRPAERRVGN